MVITANTLPFTVVEAPALQRSNLTVDNEIYLLEGLKHHLASNSQVTNCGETILHNF
jgi:hypothetical protein